VTRIGRVLRASAAIATLMLFACAANAQQKAPEKAEPAAKTKPKSACNAIADEAACKTNATCTWIAAVMDKQSGKQKRKAYCKTKPRPPVKKTKEPAKK
jgi:hypothetical protein